MIQNTNELRPATYNPRKMSHKDAAALRKSIDELGDLGGIIKNIQTGNLVGGHMRLQQFAAMGGAEIIYTWRTTETPGPSGTTGLGYIIHPKTAERFSYRETMWPIEKEKVANIAANRISGEWDYDALAQIDYELSQMSDADELLKLTGQDNKEIEKLLAGIGVEPNGEEQPDEIGSDPKDSDKLEFRMTHEQREVVEEALGYILNTHEMATQENGTRNGSALYYMARDYLDRLHNGTQTEQQITTRPADNLVA